MKQENGYSEKHAPRFGDVDASAIKRSFYGELGEINANCIDSTKKEGKLNKDKYTAIQVGVLMQIYLQIDHGAAGALNLLDLQLLILTATYVIKQQHAKLNNNGTYSIFYRKDSIQYIYYV